MGIDEAALMGTDNTALMGTDEIGLLYSQGQTDNSWGPRTIGDHGAPVPYPNSKKPMKKVPGASHGAPY
ncbi:unnamed protein product [Staurois parvus]|uniref:Uncharacterized protein n=1 Tax=Staurois parvus TaxID=386267 RepID=A0ABN9CDP6_9NEOB|nr:unnamed protein product [Staurois parvus]